MKLILSSDGFTTNEIVQQCEELVGKKRNDISVAVINEGYAVQHNNFRWVLENLNPVKNYFGGKLELVNLLALDRKTVQERIAKHDVIFVVGGHTDYLMSVMHKTNFAADLPEYLKTKVYVGSSAGSQVLCKRLPSSVYEKLYYEKDLYGVTDYLNYVDLYFIPHLESNYFPNRKENLKEAVKNHTGSPIYGLRDDSAIIINGDSITTIGSEPFIM